MNMNEFTAEHAKKCQQVDTIDKDLYLKYGVKRGLRDLNGQGVLTGLTNISNVVAFKQEDGQKKENFAAVLHENPTGMKVGTCANVRNLEKEAIQEALELAGGNRTKAAEMLGMSRTTLWRRLAAEEQK